MGQKFAKPVYVMVFSVVRNGVKMTEVMARVGGFQFPGLV
jgi:hypothetical protein